MIGGGGGGVIDSFGGRGGKPLTCSSVNVDTAFSSVGVFPVGRDETLAGGGGGEKSGRGGSKSG